MSWPRKCRASLGIRFITHRHDIVVLGSSCEDFVHGLGFIIRNVDFKFCHGFNDNRVEFSGFKTRTLRDKMLRVVSVDEGLCHLTSGTVMNTDE